MTWRVVLFWLLGMVSALGDVPRRAASFSVNLPATVNFQYDANGNLTNDGARSFYYDAENRLTNVMVAGQYQTVFAYDGLGRRRMMTNYTWQGGSWLDTNETRYVFDGALVLQERNGNNTPGVTYTRGVDLSLSLSRGGGIGGLLARTDNNGSTFYHADGSGNITALIDSNQNVVARYEYDPYGRIIGKWGSLADANRYRFSSKEFIPGAAIYHYGYRFYEPNFSRWLNRDPAGENGGMNLYRFAFNNSLNAVDTDGREAGYTYPSPGVMISPFEQTQYDQSAADYASWAINAPFQFADWAADKIALTGVLGMSPTDMLTAVGPHMYDPALMRYAPPEVETKPCPPKKPTFLYQKLGPAGEHLKYGITKNPATRYSQAELGGGKLNIIAEGSQDEMLQLERNLHSTLPIGPEEGQQFYIQQQIDQGLRPPPYY